jgi:hypothetical protein
MTGMYRMVTGLYTVEAGLWRIFPQEVLGLTTVNGGIFRATTGAAHRLGHSRPSREEGTETAVRK